MKNEELRTKNWAALPPMLSRVLFGIFMTNHKIFGFACGYSGFARASGANLMCCSCGDDNNAAIQECCSCGDYGNAAIHSSFLILNS